MDLIRMPAVGHKINCWQKCVNKEARPPCPFSEWEVWGEEGVVLGGTTTYTHTHKAGAQQVVIMVDP